MFMWYLAGLAKVEDAPDDEQAKKAALDEMVDSLLEGAARAADICDSSDECKAKIVDTVKKFIDHQLMGGAAPASLLSINIFM